MGQRHIAGEYQGTASVSGRSQAPFIPGLQLCESFYYEVVRPALASELPSLHYAAALIGDGSDVLGLDDRQSMDHDWGPRLLLFLSESDRARYAPLVDAALRNCLPARFRGYPTRFVRAEDDGVMIPDDGGVEPTGHGVQVHSVGGFLADYLGVQHQQALSVAEWLTLSEQKLLGFTSGAVYRDDVGLQEARDRFSYYPHDVWLYLMAAGWTRIGQEEHLVGRAGSVGDELGSAIIGSRLVRDIMRLSFLMEKQYAPYPKWLGTAFRRLSCSDDLLPELRNAVLAETWQRREVCLARAYECLARMHNDLAVTSPLPTAVARFHDRPYLVIGGSRFADALLRAVVDPDVTRLISRPIIGGLDQITDSTDLASCREYQDALKTLY